MIASVKCTNNLKLLQLLKIKTIRGSLMDWFLLPSITEIRFWVQNEELAPK